MKTLLIIFVLIISKNILAFNDLQLSYNKTNNADSSTTQSADYFTFIYGNLDKIFTNDLKLSFSNSIYQQYKNNNNYYISPRHEYKFDDNFYLTNAAIFNSYFNDKSTSSNSNYGLNTSLIYTDQLDANESIFSKLDLIYLNFYSRTDRKDFTFYSTNAFNQILNDSFSILFSLNFGATGSTDKNYSLFSIGPSMGGQYFLNNNLEFHFILGLSRINYSKRYFNLLINNSYYAELEKVTYMNQKVGTIYRISNDFSIELNFSTYRNSSNYTSNSYNGTLFAGKINYRW